MKRTVIVAILILMPVFLFAQTGETQDAIDALLETIDLGKWDDWFRQNGMDTTALPSKLLKQLVELQMPYGSDLSRTDLISKLTPSFGPMLAKTAFLLGLAAFGAVIGGVTDSSKIGETAETAFRIGISTAVLALSLTEIRGAYSAISSLERTSELLLPVIVGYLSLTGLSNTALLLPASFALLSDIILRLIETCVAPLAIIGGVLTVLDANGTGRLLSVGKLLHRAAKWILGTACSLYMLISAIRSISAKSADGLLLKTTKLAAGSIPAIGSLLSESVDTAYQCMQFVKNALGLTGCIVLVSLALKPVLSIFLTRSSLRVSAMLAEPLSGKRYAELLRGMGDTLHLLMLSELAALAMTLMMLAPVFGTGV